MKEIAISSGTPIIIPQNVKVLQQEKQPRAASVIHIGEHHYAHQVKNEVPGIPPNTMGSITSSTVECSLEQIKRDQIAPVNSELRRTAQ